MESSVEESKDLKEHMVGILFSQSKLTHLQKQVRVEFIYRGRFWTVSVRPLPTSTTALPGRGKFRDGLFPNRAVRAVREKREIAISA